MKKLLLGLGTVVAIAVPAISVVSCESLFKPETQEFNYIFYLKDVNEFLALSPTDQKAKIISDYIERIDTPFKNENNEPFEAFVMVPSTLISKVTDKEAFSFVITRATITAVRSKKTIKEKETIVAPIVTDKFVAKFVAAFKSIK